MSEDKRILETLAEEGSIPLMDYLGQRTQTWKTHELQRRDSSIVVVPGEGIDFNRRLLVQDPEDGSRYVIGCVATRRQGFNYAAMKIGALHTDVNIKRIARPAYGVQQIEIPDEHIRSLLTVIMMGEGRHVLAECDTEGKLFGLVEDAYEHIKPYFKGLPEPYN